MWSALEAERNIRWVHGLRDPLRRISLSHCPLSIRRAVGATHLRFQHLQRHATQFQELERTSLTKQPGMCTEIKLTDNTLNMEVEGETQVGVQRKNKTECKRRNNNISTRSREKTKFRVLRTCKTKNIKKDPCRKRKSHLQHP